MNAVVAAAASGRVFHVGLRSCGPDAAAAVGEGNHITAVRPSPFLLPPKVFLPNFKQDSAASSATQTKENVRLEELKQDRMDRAWMSAAPSFEEDPVLDADPSQKSVFLCATFYFSERTVTCPASTSHSRESPTGQFCKLANF